MYIQYTGLVGGAGGATGLVSVRYHKVNCWGLGPSKRPLSVCLLSRLETGVQNRLLNRATLVSYPPCQSATDYRSTEIVGLVGDRFSDKKEPKNCSR